MVWGCFTAHGTGELHISERKMDNFMYLQILEQKLLPSVKNSTAGASGSFSKIMTPNIGEIRKIMLQK